MIKIIPSILTHNLEQYQSYLKEAEPHFAEAQVDFMDGVFVPNRSITAKDVRQVTTPLHLEAHLMVQDPTPWITELMAAHFKKIIIHQEIGAALPGSIRLVKSLGLKVGLAINPDSDPVQAVEWWKELDTIQLMGVSPGHYGGTYQPIVIEQIRSIRDRGFSGEIEVDGGVTPETAPTLTRAGAKTLVVGHYLFGSEEAPEQGKIGERLELLRAALGNPS